MWIAGWVGVCRCLVVWWLPRPILRALSSLLFLSPSPRRGCEWMDQTLVTTRKTAAPPSSPTAAGGAGRALALSGQGSQIRFAWVDRRDAGGWHGPATGPHTPSSFFEWQAQSGLIARCTHPPNLYVQRSARNQAAIGWKLPFLLCLDAASSPDRHQYHTKVVLQTLALSLARFPSRRRIQIGRAQDLACRKPARAKLERPSQHAGRCNANGSVDRPAGTNWCRALISDPKAVTARTPTKAG